MRLAPEALYLCSSCVHLWLKICAGRHKPATFARSEALSLDSLLDRFRSHRSHRVCAGGVCGGVWLNR